MPYAAMNLASHLFPWAVPVFIAVLFAAVVIFVFEGPIDELANDDDLWTFP